MLEPSRIEALRRRVEQDPASIAFAQLAEELRRAGSYADAAAVCRAGLLHHPGYVSARVILGRALIDLGELDAAQVELDEVLHLAPQNLAAVRALADLHQRRGEAPANNEATADVATTEPQAPDQAREAFLEAMRRVVPVDGPSLGVTPADEPAAAPSPAAGVETASPSGADRDADASAASDASPLDSAGDRPVDASEWEDMSVIAADVTASAAPGDPTQEDHLYALERWLAAILDERERRRSGR